MNIAEAIAHLSHARKNGNRSCRGHGKWTYGIVLNQKWLRVHGLLPPLLKMGLGLNFAFYRYNCAGRVRGGWAGRGAGAGVAGRPQSSPILVEDAHTAVGVAEVPIIVRGKSKPGVWVVKMTPNRSHSNPGGFKQSLGVCS